VRLGEEPAPTGGVHGLFADFRGTAAIAPSPDCA
jgi:hypothetical protein